MRRDMRASKSKMAEQQKQLMEYSSRLDEYDKKNEEAARKFSTLLQVKHNLMEDGRNATGEWPA